MSNFLVSLGYTGRKGVVLGHILNAQTLTKPTKSHNILSKFTILCWATFIALLGHMRPTGHGLDTPGLVSSINDVGQLNIHSYEKEYNLNPVSTSDKN